MNNMAGAVSLLSNTEGYHDKVPVAFIVESNPYMNFSGFEWCDDIGGIWESSFTYEGAIYQIIRQYYPMINLISSSAYEHLLEIKEMGVYPESDCVRWFGDTLLIRMMD